MSGFRVCEGRCDQCLFSKEAVVSDSRRRNLLSDCARKDTHFVCHKWSIHDGSDVCCRGFYDRNPMATNLMRIAHRLGVVEFVPSPDEAPNP